MSILKPAPTVVLPEQEPSAIQSRFERLSMYFPLYSLGMHSVPVDWSFCHVGQDDQYYHTYCNNAPTSIQNGIHVKATAVVFEVTVRIYPHMCFLTTDGDRAHPYVEEDINVPRMASCWLESVGDSVQDRTVWQRALKRLQHITQQGDREVCMDEFVMPVDSPGTANLEMPPALLQVPFDLEAFSLLTASHEHIPMPSHDQVPFGKCVHAHFVLYLSASRATKKKGPLIAARVVYMHIVN
ncbi:hypothetical protein EWM64_g9780 [Hericium alpestre]|uniref:Uncharacterized protein n=1 Tax=Hericium alpestre TaxID=135208 RepID=A0A4Y9ZK52_9AGAM|nr:hypothetical protein EWM64_g9780 [Hericium alpestre]